ncbi:MAG: hypothetical protein V7629_18735 [Motiliproteus sp.]
MKQVYFNQLAIAIDSLSSCQRHLLLGRLQHPDAISAIIEHLEQQCQSDLRCPKCNHDQMFCESFKDQRKIPERPVSKRGNDNKKGAKWVPVLVARDRTAGEAGFVLKHFTLKNVEPHLLPPSNRDTVLYTDAYLTFETLTRKHHLEHKVLNARADERIKASVFPVQGVNNYHQRLKGWIQRFRVSPSDIYPTILAGSIRINQPSEFMADFIMV